MTEKRDDAFGLPTRMKLSEITLRDWFAGMALQVTAGETEATLAHELEQFIGPDTKVHVSEKLKS